MTTYIQRPTSDIVVGGSGLWTGYGGLSPWYRYLADVDDTTYFTFNSGGGTVVLGVNALSLAAGEQIKQYRVVQRFAPNVAGRATLNSAARDSAGNVGPADTFQVSTAGGFASNLATYYGAWRNTSPTGGALTPASIASIWTQGAVDTSRAVVVDQWIEIQTNFAPSAVGDALGTVTNTVTPTFTWTYSDTEGDAQERFRVAIYSSAQYSAVGFDPSAIGTGYPVPIADSGEVYSNATSWTPPVGLPNDTYRAFIRVADGGSNGHYNAVSSSGPYSSATLAVTAPATPTVAATVDTANMRSVLTMQDQQNMLSADDASFETSIGGWVSSYGATLSRIADASAEQGGFVLRVHSNVTDLNQQHSGIVPVAVGTQYTARIAVKPVTTARQVRVEIYWLGSDGTTIVGSTTGSYVIETAGVWNVRTVSGVAPTGAVLAQVGATINTPALNEEHEVDGAQLVPGTSTTWTRGGLVSSARLQVQRSDDGGATWKQLKRPWVPGIGMTDLSALDYSDALQSLITYDYEAPRGVAVQYQTRVVATISGGLLQSAWSASSLVTIPATGWWIKHVTDPTKNWNFHPALADLAHKITYEENASSSHPLGSSREVVQSDAVTGAHISWDSTILSDAEYATYTALRMSLSALLLQPPWPTEQFYVRFTGPHTVTRIVDGDAVEVKRTVAAALTEIAAP